jgi:hypothetical protein
VDLVPVDIRVPLLSSARNENYLRYSLFGRGGSTFSSYKNAKEKFGFQKFQNIVSRVGTIVSILDENVIVNSFFLISRLSTDTF